MKWIRFGTRLVNLDNVQSILADGSIITFCFSQESGDTITIASTYYLPEEWKMLCDFLEHILGAYKIF